MAAMRCRPARQEDWLSLLSVERAKSHGRIANYSKAC